MLSAAREKRDTVSYRVIAWDFDGTLVDSLDGALAIYNELAREYGFVPIDDPAPVRELTIPEFLQVHRIPLAKVPIVYTRFLRAQKSRMPQVRVHAGVREVLLNMRQRDYRLEANAVEDWFTHVLGYSRLFGKESAIRRVVKAERIDPGEVLYVGDEVRDIAAARKAGVDVVSVTWGFNSEETLLQHDPDYVVRSPAEFLPLLDQWR